MKKCFLLLLLLLTGCTNNLVCTKYNVDKDGNVSHMKYTFTFSKEEIERVKEEVEIEIRDGLSTEYHYSMHSIMYNLYKIEGVDIDGGYNENKVYFEIILDANLINEKNAITEIIYEAKTRDRAENKMLVEGYTCEGE